MVSHKNSFFHFFLKSEHESTLDLIGVLFSLFWSVVVMFIICALGERITDACDSFNVVLCQCDWYSHPIEMQQIFVMMLMNAQQPVKMKGFANTLCAHESFVKVSFTDFIRYEITFLILFFPFKLDRSKKLMLLFDASNSRWKLSKTCEGKAN